MILATTWPDAVETIAAFAFFGFCVWCMPGVDSCLL